MLVLLFAFSHIIVNACNPGPKPNFNRAGFDFDCWALCSPLLIHLSSPGNPVSYPSVAGAKPHQQTHFCEFWACQCQCQCQSNIYIAPIIEGRIWGAWKLHLVGTKPGLFLCSASWFRLTEWVRLTPSTPWLQACNQSDWLNDRVRFFEAWPGLTSSGRFRVVFLLFPEQKFRVFHRSGTARDPVSIQNRSGSIVRKPMWRGDEWRQPIRCVVYNWWFSSFVVAYFYVPINLVLCDLLSLKIIVRVYIHRHVSQYFCVLRK